MPNEATAAAATLLGLGFLSGDQLFAVTAVRVATGPAATGSELPMLLRKLRLLLSGSLIDPNVSDIARCAEANAAPAGL